MSDGYCRVIFLAPFLKEFRRFGMSCTSSHVVDYGCRPSSIFHHPDSLPTPASSVILIISLTFNLLAIFHPSNALDATTSLGETRMNVAMARWEAKEITLHSSGFPLIS